MLTISVLCFQGTKASIVKFVNGGEIRRLGHSVARNAVVTDGAMAARVSATKGTAAGGAKEVGNIRGKLVPITSNF